MLTATESILLVDDEKDFIDALAKRLQRRGFSVQVAYNAAQARELVKETIFNAAILDVNLPDGDGHELFKEIAAIQPEIKAIMLTGYGNLQKAFQLGKKGLYSYFAKPCDIEKLIEALSESMKG